MGQPLQERRAAPKLCRFVCGAMAVFRRAGRVNRVAAGALAPVQREHNEMSGREACQRSVTPERRRSRTSLGR